MKDSCWILAFFIAGILLAWSGYVPGELEAADTALYALWFFMFLCGLSIGSDSRLAEILRSLRFRTLLLPLATTIGTFAGAIVASWFLLWTTVDCLAVGAGFGYYSLSSIFISQYKGPELGTVALVSNIIRELFTLLLAPALVRYIGPAATISCGGCTTMDTTLPVITRYAGLDWVLPAIVHAMILDFSVPFWVTLFCSI